MNLSILFAVSQALLSVSDGLIAERAFSEYTNNIVRVEAVDDGEWNDLNARYIQDLVPANAPFHLIIGPGASDRRMADIAIETAKTSMPAHVRAYFTKNKVMGPVLQHLLRRYRKGVAKEMDYVTGKAHRAVWFAKDFDVEAIAEAARALTSNSVPLVVSLMSVYEKEYPKDPIRRATPVVDYPDPRPEVTFETPCSIGIVLRAVEAKRKFRFAAFAGRETDTDVNYRWVPMSTYNSSFGVSIDAIDNQRNELNPESGFAEIVLDWRNLRGRLDIAVFARHGEGPYGPPSIISFYPVPNERRAYDSEGRIAHIEYEKMDLVNPKVFQNKPWRDDYVDDSSGNIVGFKRRRSDVTDRPQRFSIYGQLVLEAYPDEQPKIARLVKYFADPVDPTILRYEAIGNEISHPLQTFVPHTRGEFPVIRARKR